MPKSCTSGALCARPRRPPSRDKWWASAPWGYETGRHTAHMIQFEERFKTGSSRGKNNLLVTVRLASRRTHVQRKLARPAMAKRLPKMLARASISLWWLEEL